MTLGGGNQMVWGSNYKAGLAYCGHCGEYVVPDPETGHCSQCHYPVRMRPRWRP